jgi:SulP family sulfate permease
MAQQPSSLRKNIWGWLTAGFSGLLVGALTIIASVSMAALVFAGGLSGHLAYGVDIALTTAVISGLLIALMSSCEVAISIPQDRTAPILAIMAAAIAAAVPANAGSEQVLSSIVTAIVVTSLITGVFLFGLGLARAGGLMRFLPYSVLGGYFAGAGWLLLLGGLRVMTNLELAAPADLLQLGDAALLVRWLPGLALALAITIASRFVSSGTALTLTLPAAAGLFFLTMLHDGETLETLAGNGWLLSPSTSQMSDIVSFSLPQLLAQSDWRMVLGQWANIGTVVVISAVSIMLTVSALESLSSRDFDINHELRVTGLANLATGLGGGMVGFHSLSISDLALRLGARNRIAGIVAALMAAAALLFGTELLGYLPRLVVGGLLASMGIAILDTWLVQSWQRLPRGEYLVVPLILLTIAGLGFIEGLIVGLLAALIQFVLKYSRTTVVRYALSGRDARSTVERNLDDERFLSRQGAQVLALKLRGYLFFGTAAQLSVRVRARVTDPSKPRLRYLLLDFKGVYGVDSSAAHEFRRLRRLAGQRGFTIVLTGMTADLLKRLHAGNISEHDEHVCEFHDLDHGLEWCENQMLDARRLAQREVPQTALQLLAQQIGDEVASVQFISYLSEVAFAPGDQLMRQGEESGDLYFVERGDVSVYLKPASGETLRIRRTGPGTVLGELGFYLGTPRSASVIAENTGKAYRLTAASLERMEREHPALAAAMHRFIADLLAERLLRTTRTLEGVLS